VTIDVGSVTELTWSQFDLLFDKSVVKVEDVTEGSIDDTEIPIADWARTDSDTITVMTSVSEDKFLEGVSGSGYLAKISFKVKGDEGDDSVLELSNVILGNTSAGEIPATWIEAEIKVGVEEKEEEEEEEPTPSPTPTEVTNVTGVTNETNVTETPTPTPTLAPEETPTPTPTLVPGETPKPAATPAVKPTPKPTAPPTSKGKPTPKPAVPGFGAVFAIAVISAIAYILLRREGGKEE
jgi:PGF-CTERM protein